MDEERRRPTIQELENELNKTDPVPMGKVAEFTGGCSRQSAEGVLLDKIRRKRNEMYALETLHKSINWKLISADQESNLWNLFLDNIR